jgi:pilus assembly protein Flp/PilA
MLSLIHRFRRDERGATAIEYSMLVVFIALAIAVGATALSTGINDLFGKVGNYLSGVAVPPNP